MNNPVNDPKNDPKFEHNEFVRIGRMRHKLKNQLLVLLPKIYESGIYKKYASSIYEYAAKFGDLSKYAVETRLRLEPNLVDKPYLKAAIAKVGVKKVAMVAKLATPETEEIFAARIVNMNKSSVQTLSRELRQASEITKDMVVKCEAKPQNIKLELDDEMTFLFLKVKRRYGGNLSNKEVMRKILEVATTGEKIPVLPSAVGGVGMTGLAKIVSLGEMTKLSETTEQSKTKSLPGQTSEVPAGRAKKYANAALKRKVRERSHGKCEYNNCNKPAEHFHHTGRFAENHSHEGIIHVCKDHHQILHNGFVKNEQEPPQYWQLTLNQPLGYADDCYRKCREEALK